jgi:hypothetical protein
MGHGNLEFISLLTELWDYEGAFENKIKNGKSIRINNPTISILGGNTPTGFVSAFPSEIFGQGFFSRLLLIYGEPNGRRIAFPEPPSDSDTSNLVELLGKIRSKCNGEAEITPQAKELLGKIYSQPFRFNDIRFESYYSRRLNHLIKLCLICAASRISNVIETKDVIYANTILTHTEHLMPKALGEFGKAKNSDVTQKIVALIYASTLPVPFMKLWKAVSSDLSKTSDLADLVQGLVAADKIQAVTEGFLPKRAVLDRTNTYSLDFGLLTDEENEVR